MDEILQFYSKSPFIYIYFLIYSLNILYIGIDQMMIHTIQQPCKRIPCDIASNYHESSGFRISYCIYRASDLFRLPSTLLIISLSKLSYNTLNFKEKHMLLFLMHRYYTQQQSPSTTNRMFICLI
jgi:hypothetical protein